MAWRPQALFSAFARHGMLCNAVYQPGGVATPFLVQLAQPDTAVLAGEQQIADRTIEYETAAIPALRRGDLVDVTDAQGLLIHCRARAHPVRRGDGYFSRCDLEEV